MLADLEHFTGSESIYTHPLFRFMRYTEGAHYVAEKAGAFWLLDKIAASQVDPRFAAEPFQAWKLAVTGHRATLTCDDGDGRVIEVEEIPFTDFPEPGITLWCTDGTILLPSEY